MNDTVRGCNPILVAGHVRRAQTIRDEKGFNPTSNANLDRKIMAVFVELRELRQALRQANTEGVGPICDEIADVAIYLMTMIGDLYAPSEWVSFLESRCKPSLNPYASPDELTADVERHLERAWRTWRSSYDVGISQAREELRWAFVETCRLAAAIDVDLHQAVSDKMDFNATRPPTHGGKHPDT